ncbi:MAG: chitobiase/beta-hexosaminidase C-terminal domain-containing protein [Terracidiphilus sp.]
MTTTTLTASPNPQMYGQPITFTATVKGSSGSTPTGTVGFSYQGLLANGTPYAFGPWNNVAVNGVGVAEFTTSSLPSGWIGDVPGSIGVVAYYLGNANNSPSYGSMEETINQIPTTTTITANPSSAPYGTPITFTATVVETASGKPAQGLVSFDISSTTFASSELNSAGQTTWISGALGNGSVLQVGSQTLTAKFSTKDGAGDQWSHGSVTVNITALGATAVPTFSPPAGTYSTTQSVTLNSATSGATIYYTADGSTPTAGSEEYVAGFPIQVRASETIQAIAVAQGDSTSPVASAAYVVNLSAPSFTVSGTAVTVAPGTTGNTSTITVTPFGGWTGNVALTAVITSSPAGALDSPTVSFGSTSPVSITGTSTETATLTIFTTAATGAAFFNPNHNGVPWYATSGMALACVLLFGIPACRRRWQAIVGMVALLVILAGGVLACGGGGSRGGSGGGSGNPGTTVGSYTISVTGTSGTTTATGTIALTVQ